MSEDTRHKRRRGRRNAFVSSLLWRLGCYDVETTGDCLSRRARDIDRQRERVHPVLCHLQMWNVAVAWP